MKAAVLSEGSDFDQASYQSSESLSGAHRNSPNSLEQPVTLRPPQNMMQPYMGMNMAYLGCQAERGDVVGWVVRAICEPVESL